MTSFDEDYAYGKEQERLCFRRIRRYLGGHLKHNEEIFAPFDFEDNSMAVEMKARKMLSTEYEDAMINSLKVDRCETETRQCFLIFKYLDKLCCIEYDKEKFSKYRRRMMKLEDRVDKKAKWEERIFIPMSDMELIDQFKVECMID